MSGPPPAYEPKEFAIPAGNAVFYLENSSDAINHGSHNLTIGEEVGKPIAQSGTVLGGERAVFTVHGLEAGSYVFWCSLYQHAEFGMKGTLTVE